MTGDQRTKYDDNLIRTLATVTHTEWNERRQRHSKTGSKKNTERGRKIAEKNMEGQEIFPYHRV